MLSAKHWSLRILLAVAIAGLIPGAAMAGPGGGDKKPPTPDAKKKDKPEFPKFEDAMKGFEEVPTAEPPFIPLWHNKKQDSLRAQIPAGLVGKQFLVATSMAGGPFATGFQLDHFLAYFDRMDKKLVLMRVDPRYVEPKGEPVADVIKRSYGGDIILKVLPIITMKGGDPVIDLDGTLKGDFAGIGPWGGGAVNASLSKWAKFKAFPENIELEADLALMQKDSGRRILFHYSISKIPDSAKNYKPRVADDRIGYFLTARKDWSKKHDSKTLFDRYVNRWHLEKRDPSAELSAPKHPIVWYIEKTVPLKYRRWVKEGILEWNKAFEKCGFLDAIEVIQQEDYDPRTKDLDPEDVRYNFFRWIVTGRGFAMGPSRNHPLTGQIFDADIVFDDTMVRTYLDRYDYLTASDAHWKPFNPMLDHFFETHPQYAFRTPWENLLPKVKLQDDPHETFYDNLMAHMHERGRPVCEYAFGMTQQLAFASVAMEARGIRPDDEEFIGQIVKEIVMHEVGHCLGLRHNFKASTWLPMEEIEEHKLNDDPNVGSVMDYNPPIVMPRDQSQGSFTTRSIGPYDYWAIEYGYRPAGKPHKNDEEMLQAIAGRVAEAGLDYATDEDTMSFLSPDPLSNRFDMGRDVVAFAKHQTELANNLLKDMDSWAVKEGESYTRVRDILARVMGQRASATSFVARFVGGQIINRDHKGDPNARIPVQVVAPEEQRDALKFVCENVFAEGAYDIDPKLLKLLAPGRFYHWGSDDYDFQIEFNIHDFILSSQYRCLLSLLNPFTISRVHDNQVRFIDDQKAYTLAEHIQSISNVVWSELNERGREGSENDPYITSIRRNLQRKHLDLMMNLILTKPGTLTPADASSIARLSAAELSEKIGDVLDRGDLDMTSRAHLVDVKKRIDKALEAEYSAGYGSSGGLFLFFREPPKDRSQESITILPNQ